MEKNKDYKYENLAERVEGLIREGSYAVGDRLPSVRKLSREQGVSISTVLQAYMLLENQGLIETRPQSGYYVRKLDFEPIHELLSDNVVLDPGLVSIQELVMMILRDTQNPDLVQLGTMMPKSELMPVKQMNRIISRLLREQKEILHQCQIPPGLEALRIQIARRSLNFGCQFSPNEVLITNGVTEAINLCLQAVCQPGDIVAIESPMYFGTLQSLELHGLRALEIPTHPQTGISLEALRFALDHNPVKAVLTISNFNNPLGSCMPDDHKQSLAAMLEEFDIPLIENDIYGDLYFSGKRPTTVKTFEKDRVMLCSSFTKDISTGFRVGWVAPGRYQEQLEWLKVATSLAAPTLQQIAIAEFLSGGGYDKHLRIMRREYAAYTDLISQAVVHYFPSETRISRPSGGSVLWVQVPGKLDALALYKRALENSITIAPGHLFSPSGQFNDFIRLKASNWSYPIEKAIQRLGELTGEMLEEK